MYSSSLLGKLMFLAAEMEAFHFIRPILGVKVILELRFARQFYWVSGAI